MGVSMLFSLDFIHGVHWDGKVYIANVPHPTISYEENVDYLRGLKSPNIPQSVPLYHQHIMR